MQLKFNKTQSKNYFTDLETVEIIQHLSLSHASFELIEI